MRLSSDQKRHPSGGVCQPLLLPAGGRGAVLVGEVHRLVQQAGRRRIVEGHPVDCDRGVAQGRLHLRVIVGLSVGVYSREEKRPMLTFTASRCIRDKRTVSHSV